MKNLSGLVVVAMLGLLGVVGLAPAAQAYPDVNFNLTVNRQVVYGGQTFTATATSNVTCDWTLVWNGQRSDTTRTHTSSLFVTTYTADAVTKVTKIPLEGTCRYTVPTERAAAGAHARLAARATWHKTIMITVLPRGSALPPTTDTGLPNTGGPSIWLLVAGFALAGSGAIAVARSRRAVTA